MKNTLRLLRPAPNQNIQNPRLWQDPLLGYYETHGKMEFLPGEQYNLTDDEKKAVLWRYRVKEILKKEFLRREFDPHTYKYKQGVIIDPAMFRWYAADRTQSEFLHYKSRSVYLYSGLTMLTLYIIAKVSYFSTEKNKVENLEGERLWWDRTNNRRNYVCGSGHPAPSVGASY